MRWQIVREGCKPDHPVRFMVRDETLRHFEKKAAVPAPIPGDLGD